MRLRDAISTLRQGIDTILNCDVPYEQMDAALKLVEEKFTSTNTGSPKSAIEIVERLAAWSRKYPQNVVHSATVQKEYEKEIADIESAAKHFVDSRLRAGA